MPATVAGVAASTLAVFVLMALTADALLALRADDEGTFLQRLPSPHADGRRRVLLLGDSLLSGAAPELAVGFGDDVETRFEGAPGTGPLTPQGQWKQSLQDAVNDFNPDVVVIEACCNYDPQQPHRVYGGAEVEPDSPEMYRQWELAIDDLVSLAGRRGAHVFLVTIPDADPAGLFGGLNPRIARLNEIYVRLGLPLIDWRAALQPDGGYTATLGAGASNRRIRATDGLHLTDEGDQVVAGATWDAIRPVLSQDPPASPAP